ncbi:MAG: UDP-N-acetylmuramate dehydrogenase [Saprospiraceae bacterium]|nr:UDP-N-acetylmuramate dehydrogenase [Saprospiraceae bacterium]MBK9220934.1 UDP-N-acetylmuramate dehydrogenase [Saprospiraceae bacterium]
MISLKPFNSFGVESFAKEMIQIQKEEDLIEVNYNEGYRILGEGSNILLTQNQAVIILKNEIKGIQILEENDAYAYVKVGGGESWHSIVLWALQHNLGGIENLSLIPGSVGAAPVQNIGAYGVELKDVMVELNGFHIPDRAFLKFTNPSCHFGYRTSIFKTELKQNFFINSIVLKLTKKHVLQLNYGTILDELNALKIDNPKIQDVSKAIINIRNSKLPNPAILGNAGSFFKNTSISRKEFNALKLQFPQMPGYSENDEFVKVPSGWLIDQCGWKGRRKGDVGSYEKQALVLVNFGNASGFEILDFAMDIITSVKNRFGIELTPEVNIW